MSPDNPMDWNADRHQARGDYWLALGKPDYAEGSYRKAARNRELSRRLDAALGRPHGPPDKLTMLRWQHEDAIIGKLVNEVTSVILYG